MHPPKVSHSTDARAVTGTSRNLPDGQQSPQAGPQPVEDANLNTGPAYYDLRRIEWLTPIRPSTPAPPSISRIRLQELLSSFDPSCTDDPAWEGGIEKVWSGLCRGTKLKGRLPMSTVVKIVHCAWIQDQTWPVGAVAPDPDDVLPETVRNDQRVYQSLGACSLEVMPKKVANRKLDEVD